MKIFHVADIHLGRRRLDGRLPDDDIAKAFRFIVDEAVREKADVFTPEEQESVAEAFAAIQIGNEQYVMAADFIAGHRMIQQIKAGKE